MTEKQSPDMTERPMPPIYRTSTPEARKRFKDKIAKLKQSPEWDEGRRH
jgi:hypothetical protein